VADGERDAGLCEGDPGGPKIREMSRVAVVKRVVQLCEAPERVGVWRGYMSMRYRYYILLVF